MICPYCAPDELCALHVGALDTPPERDITMGMEIKTAARLIPGDTFSTRILRNGQYEAAKVTVASATTKSGGVTVITTTEGETVTKGSAKRVKVAAD